MSTTHRSSSRASRRSPPPRPYPASATRRRCSVRLPTRKRHREVEKGIEAVANVAAAQAGNAALQLAAKHPGDVAVVPSEVQRPSSVRLILGGEPRHCLVAQRGRGGGGWGFVPVLLSCCRRASPNPTPSSASSVKVFRKPVQKKTQELLPFPRGRGGR